MAFDNQNRFKIGMQVLLIQEKPSFAAPTGGATNATQKTRFLPFIF
jgi:hypothetical protein